MTFLKDDDRRTLRLLCRAILLAADDHADVRDT